MTASFVRWPNKLVSFPGEPAPLAETRKPFLLRNLWSSRTSSPSAPRERFLVGGNADDFSRGKAGPDVGFIEINSNIFFLVDGPTYPVPAARPTGARMSPEYAS